MVNDTKDSVKATMERVEKDAGRGRLKRWIIGAVVMLAAVGGGAAIKFRPVADAPRYQTTTVDRGNLLITVSATGNLEATNQVDVGSELSGIVTSVLVDFNDSVKRGQPLANLDDTKLRAAVLKSRAEVASARASYKEKVATRNAAGKTLSRYQKTRELTGGKLPSLENLEQAEADLERAAAAVTASEAAIEMAEASLKSNETDLEKTVIYAPINGIVLSRDIEPGQTVAASLQAPILFTLAEDLRNMELQVDVDEADVGKVKEGQNATFSVDAYPEQTFTAEITQVRYGAETTDGVVTYKTVLKVENPDLLLRPGMTATADIIVRNIENALLVSNTALRFNPFTSGKSIRKTGGFLSSLLPGPRRRVNTRSGDSGGREKKSDSVKLWQIGDNGRAVPVGVEKIATDGVMTAIQSSKISEGAKVITNEIMTGG